MHRGALAVTIFGILAGVAPAGPVPAWADVAEVTVLAGTGKAGFGGDGGPASQAQLANPTGVAVGPDGTVYVGDSTNRRVRAVRPDGTIVTVAGSGRSGDRASGATELRSAIDIDLGSPQKLAVGGDGTLYVADPGLLRVFARTTDGRMSVVAGVGSPNKLADGGPAVEAGMGEPRGLALAADGTIYISDLGNRRVRAVAPNGVITTVAGSGGSQLAAAGGAATLVAVPAPDSLAVDAAGTVWMVDGQGVRRLRGGNIETVTYGDGRWATSDANDWPPPQPPLVGVSAVAAHGDAVLIVNQATETVYRLNGDGSVVEVARLSGVLGGPSVGQMAVSPSGAVYLSDVNSHRVYMFRLAPREAAGPDDGSGPWWPWVAGGVAILVVIAVWSLARRRRAA